MWEPIPRGTGRRRPARRLKPTARLKLHGDRATTRGLGLTSRPAQGHVACPPRARDIGGNVLIHRDTHRTERRFILSLALTGLVLVAEIGGGLWTGSLALLSDAAHVFLDLFALGLSYIALRLAALPPDDRHTYGFHRLQVLAALANGATLLLVAFEIFREAWARFQNPVPVLAGPMLAVAVLGLAINVVVALILHEHGRHDLNVRSAFLHVLGDALSPV